MANANDFHIENGTLISYTGREESITVPEQVHTIGEGAFKACVSVKHVVLPDHLRCILSGAFKGCRKLETIRIPDGVSVIGDYAFHRCHSLESIALPSSVRELGDCVFLYCDRLTHVRIPGVKRLGKQVFVNDVLLTDLEISPHLQETCICDVFTGCSRLSRISFPDGQEFVMTNAVEAIAGEMKLPSLVRTIAADVLRMMELDGRCLVKFLTNLKHVEIPEGIEKIGKSCFFDKRGILSVTLPASLREIESRAFRNCISLEMVHFQQEQVIIHEDAFKNCTSLKEILTPDGTAHPFKGIVCTEEEDTVPLVGTIHRQVLGNFRISGTILLNYLGNESRVLVPDGITRIAEEAFAGKEAIDRVILPESLTEIGAGAFRDCLLLQNISFPDRLIRIGAGAFEHCVKLLRIVLPPKLTHLEDRVFKHCHKLKEIAFPDCLLTIGEQAFYGCRSLHKVHFPNHLSSIGTMAFYRCRGLNEICLLPETASVGNLAFAQSGVQYACLGGTGTAYGTDLFYGCCSLHTLVLEKGMRHIPDKLAYGCTALSQVKLPDTIESAGKNVWEYTPFLEEWNKTKPGSIFWDGRDLAGEICLSKRYRIIAGGAFYGNTALTTVSFSEQTVWIGPAALKGCCNLRRVLWPSSITTLEAEVFSGCTSLETIELFADLPAVPGCQSAVPGYPSADTRTASSRAVPGKPDFKETAEPAPVAMVPWLEIRERAFYHCQTLRRILLNHVRKIGKKAFSGCTHLFFDMTSASALVQVEEGIVEGVHSCADQAVIGTILVSGGAFSGKVHLPEGITAIAPFAFSENHQITELFLPESLRHIGEGAFWNCRGLSEIHFSSKLSSVGARAFEKCTSLREIRLYADQIGADAFACCISLNKAELTGITCFKPRLFAHCTNLETCIMEHVTVIGNECFCGCSRLTGFNAASVQEIGSYSFQNCNSLRRITLYDHTLLHPHAFEDCCFLEQICLAGNQGILRLEEYAFSGCTSLTQVIHQKQSWTLHRYRDCLSNRIPEMVRLIFHSAFSCFSIDQEEILCGYRGLGQMVRIPEGIRRIEAEVFRDVLMLEQIHIPETVEYIGARAFHGTAWIKQQQAANPMVIVRHMLLDGSCCTGEVTIPEDIRLICGWAFAGGTGIEKIRLLSNRTRTETYAFRNCIYLNELILADGTSIHFHGLSDLQRELPPLACQIAAERLNCFKTDEHNRLIECTGNISRLRIADGITAIGDHAFQDGNLLTQITLAPTVTSIGRFAFAGCKWLNMVNQAHHITRIDDCAFSGCGQLKRIELSEHLHTIGIRAFEHCTSLSEILIPEGIEEIPDKAFFRCQSLKTISLPSTLKRIGKEAFAYCRNLEQPVIPSNVFIDKQAFTGIKEDD